MKANYLAAAKRNDVLARWGITFGGLAIIGSMLVMIVFMAKVTLPLFTSPEKELMTLIQLGISTEEIVAFGADPQLEQGFAVTRNGEALSYKLSGGQVNERMSFEKPSALATAITRAEQINKNELNLVWDDGSVSSLLLNFDSQHGADGARITKVSVSVGAVLAPEPGASEHLQATTQRIDDEHRWFCRPQLDNSFKFALQSRVVDFMGEATDSLEEGLVQLKTRGTPVAYQVTGNGRRLYVATDAGELCLYDLQSPATPNLIDQVQASKSPITALQLLFGDESVVVGDALGQLTAYTLASGKKASLAKTQSFKAHDTTITRIVRSYRDKSFFSGDAKGLVHMNHLTTGRFLLQFGDEAPLERYAVSERGNAFMGLDSKGELWLWELKAPHVEVSFSTMWNKIHYEGYEEPVWAWQSSSASDDFEPKKSLAPLLFGSLKGTFYGMLFSFPLALFAAIYTSYMMNSRWRTIVKPVIELMAAIPSVVTGFLAALWLAPRLEHNLAGVAMALVMMPLVTAGGMYLLFRRGTKISGSEWLWSIPFLLIGGWLALKLGGVFQDQFFGGNIHLWFYEKLGLQVDQRNCVVIGFALGFAVIPIIFTISEDALSNVPKHLSAAALALGSSRWQAMRRVILPMASPGIFAATMIGFGRAVGETMIVLMATGNTPIMSPSILNGMRTLSANIATEIPEAPVNSSLYRLLFLSAVLLFAMTFVVNTAAEIVRVRLNQKYKNL